MAYQGLPLGSTNPHGFTKTMTVTSSVTIDANAPHTLSLFRRLSLLCRFP